MNPTPSSKMIYVPPRPNLGPEPMLEPQPVYILAALGIVAILLLLSWRLRRSDRAKPLSAEVVLTLPPDSNDSPRERMIAWSLALRESLAARFGPSWRAKTTEEIAGDPALPAAIGPERAEWLAGFLADADRAKFADSDQIAPGPTDSELRELAELVASRTS